jgi:hypothetical protein
VAIRGAIKCVLASLAILGVWSEIGRAGDLVKLTGWAGEGSVVNGNGVGDDVFQLVAEAEWDRSASRDVSLYQVRVAYPDGRVDTRAFPRDYPPGRRRFSVYVAASPIRSQFPSSVKVAVTVVDAASGRPVSNTLSAGIEQFPRPKGDASANDPGPFGWGQPLEGVERILPNAGPDGLRFARIPASGNLPGFSIATTESTIGKVGQRLKGYDPKAGRSDEFALEAPEQPAINLTPAQASDYLKALSMADPSGVAFRLPTVEEWLRAAKAGKSTAFWWGDEPTFPEGANLLGPEPALAADTTATSQPPATSPTFKANPFGLAHTFGNAAEWATDPAGGFARMGGHFRTEPASPLPEVKVEKADQLGPDPFVGVRLAFDLTAESGAALIRKRLATDPKLSGVAVTFDPDTASVRLTGSVAGSSTIRAADQALEGLWFIASVQNNLKTESVGANQLAILGMTTEQSRRVGVLDRTFVEVPLSVRWLDPLPVHGSEWWVNVYLPGGGHLAHKLDTGEPGRASKTRVLIDRARLAALGLADNTTVKIALSLGSPAATPDENRVVSNVVAVRPLLPARTR